MKTLKTLALACCLPFAAWSQSQYKLDVEQEVLNDTLYVDFYIQKTAGPDFPLGSSNLAVNVDAASLDMASMFRVPHPGDKWDVSTDASSYVSMGVGGNQIVHLAVRRNTSGMGNGQLVTATRERVGTIGVPVTNGCTTQDVTWVTGPAAFTNFSGQSIKSGATFENPTAGFKLCTVPAAPQAIGSTSIEFCDGQQSDISTNYTGSLQWFKDGQPLTNATTSTLTVAQSGTYYAQAQNCLCTTDGQTFTVTVNTAPAQPIVLVTGTDLLASTVSGATSYQWYFNGNAIAGATSQAFTPTVSGNYAVEAVNSCGNTISTQYPFSITGLAGAVTANFGLEASPNPFVSQASIRFSLPSSGAVKMEVYNVLGEKVAVLKDDILPAGKYQVQFNDNGQAAGAYFVRLQHDEKVQMIKLVKMK